MSKSFTVDEVASHNKPADLFIIVDGDVYDVTEFQEAHPGGQKILQRVGGKDASKQFWKYHNESILKKYQPKLMVGSLDSKPKSEESAAPAASSDGPATQPEAIPGTGAVLPGPSTEEVFEKRSWEALESFGDMVPYADPSWYQSYISPFYNQSHVDLRAEIRKYVEEEVMPYVNDWDVAKKIPEKVYQDFGKRGYLHGLMHIVLDEDLPFLKDLPFPASVKPENWDAFHELIVTDELSRCGSGGVVWNVLGGFGIGGPPLFRFGSDELVSRIAPSILRGEKRICLAITEPDGGSDVANLGCEAKLTEDKKHFIVNGEKKWITNGIWCDYFTTAVRTSDNGMNGITVLLIEKGEGVSVRQMDCQGVHGSGTTYVTFEDAKVPVGNVLGKVDEGFRVIMGNFNHERIGIIIQAVRFARVCYEESVKYAHKRVTFGVKLYSHAVIRMKLAEMARQIEATYAWLELLIFQASNMDEEEAMLKLGGAIAGCKAQSTRTFEFCAREASQIFGGLSYTKGGQGAKVERLYRDVRAYAIPGGSEEIMLDLSIRQSIKVHQVLGMKL